MPQHHEDQVRELPPAGHILRDEVAVQYSFARLQILLNALEDGTAF